MSKLSVDVLIVDDDDDLCGLYKQLLGMEGYTCSVAHNGLTALQAIAIIQPKLVLLDLVMPVLDGFSFLDRLRAESPPVIVVTGAAAVTGVVGLTNGMKHKVRHVLIKPVQADVLLEAVATVLTGAETKGPR